MPCSSNLNYLPHHFVALSFLPLVNKAQHSLTTRHRPGLSRAVLIFRHLRLELSLSPCPQELQCLRYSRRLARPPRSPRRQTRALWPLLWFQCRLRHWQPLCKGSQAQLRLREFYPIIRWRDTHVAMIFLSEKSSATTTAVMNGGSGNTSGFQPVNAAPLNHSLSFASLLALMITVVIFGIY